MTSHRSSFLVALVTGTLALAACGGGSDDGSSSDSADSDVAVDSPDDGSADDGAGDSGGEEADSSATDSAATDNGATDAGDDSGVASNPAAFVDPTYHHVSADAPPSSYGPRCNPDNERPWAPGWRITVPSDWTYTGAGGSNSFYDISFDTPDGSGAKVDWAETPSFFIEGPSAGEVDFDGETVTVIDGSDDTNTVFAISFIAQSTGGFIEMQGGEPVLNQVAVTSPVAMGMTRDDAVGILTTMQRERCAVYDALALENAAQLTVSLLPVFDGGDPLGKELPTTERIAFDPAGIVLPTAASYTDDQLAYIVGFDQATSDCFVAAIRPTLPTDPTDIDAAVNFADPITPDTDDEVAAQQAALAGC